MVAGAERLERSGERRKETNTCVACLEKPAQKLGVGRLRKYPGSTCPTLSQRANGWWEKATFFRFSSVFLEAGIYMYYHLPKDQECSSTLLHLDRHRVYLGWLLSNIQNKDARKHACSAWNLKFESCSGSRA